MTIHIVIENFTVFVCSITTIATLIIAKAVTFFQVFHQILELDPVATLDTFGSRNSWIRSEVIVKIVEVVEFVLANCGRDIIKLNKAKEYYDHL